MLVLCLPIAFTLGALHDGLADAHLRAPFHLTRRVIQVGLTNPPDLELSKMPTLEMIDYATASLWRDRFSSRYAQYLVDYDRRTFRQTYADVVFDNGFFWRCRVLGFGQSVFCRDLNVDAREWIKQFVRSGAMLCPDCAYQIAPEAAAWQSPLRGEYTEPQIVTVTHHTGGVLQARAQFDGVAVRCWFVGADPLIVRRCATE